MCAHSHPSDSHSHTGAGSFADTIAQGIETGRLDPHLERFELPRLARAVQRRETTILDNTDCRTFRALSNESPAGLLMRTAMGLACHESRPDEQALHFFELMADGDFLPAPMVLRHAGTRTIAAPEGVMDPAATAVRGANDWREGDTLVLSSLAAEQWPRPPAGCCLALSAWHADLDTFLSRLVPTPGIATMIWLPDLFMKRLAEDGEWSLFPPAQCPELNVLYGAAFEARYIEHERHAARAPGQHVERLRARELWQRLMQLLNECGGPWPAFRDTCNLASLQRHAGVVQATSADGALLLNSDADTTATAVRGVINLERHLHGDLPDAARLRETARSAVRMLDNAVELLAADPRAARSLRCYRSLGIAPGGLTEALAASEAHDRPQRLDALVGHFARAVIEASQTLAHERGPCPAFAGSLWQQGVLPQDAAAMIRRERGDEWCELADEAGAMTGAGELREGMARQGLRNLALMAVGTHPGLARLPIALPDGAAFSLEEMARAQHHLDQAWAVAGAHRSDSDSTPSTRIQRAWRLGIRTLTTP